MHIQAVVGLLLSTLTLLTRGRLSDRRESPRSKVLRAILLQERDYEAISKRYDTSRGSSGGSSSNSMAPSPHHSLRFECCPSVSSRIRPLGGLSREGKLLQLFRSDRVVQQLYETRCRPDVANKACQMVDPLIKRFSRCVQKYSYAYAFVKDFNVTQDYRLDYVRVRSGCSCEVDYSLPESREYH